MRARQEAADIPAALPTVDLSPAAARWAAGEILGLRIHGPIGTGKTTQAASAAREMLKRRSLRWASAPLLMARLGSGFTDTTARAWATEVLTGRVPLVLDDIDKCRPSAYAAEQMFCAIDERISREVPLLITSNLELPAISKHWPEPYGEAIASRIGGYCTPLQFGGKDRRQFARG